MATTTRLASTAAYAYAGLVKDVVTFATTAPAKLPQTREDLTAQVSELTAQLRAGVDKFVGDASTLLDSKADEGRKAVEQLRTQPQVSKLTSTLEPVLKQAENARKQVKAATTSTRKTVDAAVDAGKKLAN